MDTIIVLGLWVFISFKIILRSLWIHTVLYKFINIYSCYKIDFMTTFKYTFFLLITQLLRLVEGDFGKEFFMF